MAAYIPYQVEFKVQGAGKTLGVTKKKIMWKFGFADSEAVSKGFSGSGCRGSEHEINFVWSLKSGKREISCDGKQVHFSESGMNGWTTDRTFQHHFNLHSPNYGTIRCHLITLPPNHDAPGGNQPFQLRVNGVNFLDFCKIFQLGTSAMIVRPAPGGGGPRDDPYMTPEERQAIARAKLESLRDIRKVNSKDDGEIAAPVSTAEQSLISFESPPPQQAYGGAANRGMSSMTMDPVFRSTSFGDHSGSHSGGPPPAPAPAPYSNYALPAATAAPQYGQPPPAYGQPPTAPAYGQPPPVYGQQPAAPAYAQQPAAPAYGQPAPAAPQYAQAPQQNYGFAQPPAAAPAYNPQQNSSMAAAPGMAFAQPPATQQLAVQTNAPPNAYGQQATTPQSQMSYGSAPSFAQPPRQPGQQYGGY